MNSNWIRAGQRFVEKDIGQTRTITKIEKDGVYFSIEGVEGENVIPLPRFQSAAKSGAFLALPLALPLFGDDESGKDAHRSIVPGRVHKHGGKASPLPGPTGKTCGQCQSFSKSFCEAAVALRMRGPKSADDRDDRNDHKRIQAELRLKGSTPACSLFSKAAKQP
jgi:hypothetical protein